MPGQTKAQGLLSIIAILRERLSPESFRAMVEALPAPTRAVVDNPPLPMTWLPAEIYFDLLDTLDRKVWPNDPEQIVALGRERMKRDLKTIYKVLMHVMSVQAVLQKGSAIWHTYTRDVADMAVRQAGDREATVSYTNAALANPAFWHFQRGAVPGIIESGGAKNVSVRVIDGGGHAPFCTLAVSWS
jgi:hypothetical protein